MSEPFIGEIRMFAGNFAPRGYAFCDGQLLAIVQNEALFSLFGTIYGGDGRVTFGLPDLRGRIPVHAGGSAGPGLTRRNLGQKSGAEQATVTVNQLPAHSHGFSASDAIAGDTSPVDNVTARSSGASLYGSGTPVAMDARAIGNTGGGQSHDNVMPFLCIYFIVALVGIFPSES
jgi:microcystin-dependent protein